MWTYKAKFAVKIDSFEIVGNDVRETQLMFSHVCTIWSIDLNRNQYFAFTVLYKQHNHIVRSSSFL